MLKKARPKTKIILQFTLSIYLSLCLALPTHAVLSDSTLDYFAENDIFYYNPSGSTAGGLNGCSSLNNGSNTNYAGVQVLTDGQMEAISANQPFYQAAVEKVAAEDGITIPWQAIAAIHYMEHSLQRDNPTNGQGAYQLYSYTRIPGTSNLDPEKAFLPAGPLSDAEFQEQTNLMAHLLATSYGAGLDLTTEEGIKSMFFKYNGTAKYYRDKALAMGFTEEESWYGEGSYYVMNRYDERRDPTAGPERMDPNWPGAYVRDGEPPNTTWTTDRFGAFVIYQAVGGCGGLSSGGVKSFEEALSFMETYVNLTDEECHTYTSCSSSSSGGVLANCVTFSQYFIARFTTAGLISPMGNGGEVVGNLLGSPGSLYNYRDKGFFGADDFGTPGTTPRPYAIFSTDSGVHMCGDHKCGHTGVILGIDEANGKIYLGQEAYDSPLSWGLQRHKIEYDLTDDFFNGTYRYAYTDNILLGI